MTTKEFIKKANIIHGDRYDYSKTVYVNSRTKTTIICKIHGEIEQIPRAHLNSGGCYLCASNKLTAKEFIKKANLVHDFLYQYEKLTYTTAHNKVMITCSKHGGFKQRADAHLSGRGCPQCALSSDKRHNKNINNFVEVSNEIHNGEYDYEKSTYITSRSKITITCNKHGDFEQRASAHMSGQRCPRCSLIDSKKSLKEFIEKSRKIHNNKYDYSKVRYVNVTTKVTIICRQHGEFKQKPSQHMANKNGCPKCGHESMK